ncbi:MAG: ABC transporter permease [Spirochaetales bacterium]|nr:ABC transporter permease [Spirochaetales bacterium]
MNSLRIAWKYIKQNLKRPIALSLLIVSPVFLILILGLALSGVFSQGQVTIDMKIGYYCEEKGNLYAGFKMFLQQLDDFKVTSEETESIHAGEEKTRQREYQAFIIIDEKQKSLELVLNNNSGVQAGIIEGILNGFLARFDFYNLVFRYKPEALESVITSKEADFITHSSLNASRQPRAIDYFGITILTMAILYGSFIGSFGVIKEKSLKTLNRIYTAPVTRVQFLLGICLGTIIILMLQLLILLLTEKYLLNIYFGENVPVVIALLFCESIFALSLGVGIAHLLDNINAVTGILNGFIPCLIFLGGGYMKLPDTGLFKILSWFSPLSWVNKALYEIIYSTSHHYFFPALLFCLVPGIVLLGISTIKAVRRKTI